MEKAAVEQKGGAGFTAAEKVSEAARAVHTTGVAQANEAGAF
jgi:hypothetical protein